MAGRRSIRSENQKKSLLTVNVGDNIDIGRVTKARVVLRKISLEKLRPCGTLKLTKKPFVKLKKVHVSDSLLSKLRKEYSVGGRYRNKLKVELVNDEEIDLIKEIHAERGKKRKKLKVRIVPDCQTTVIEEISKYNCAFKRTPPDLKQTTGTEQVKNCPKITVVTVSDADTRSVRDVGEHLVRKPVRRINSALRYLKPSKTADNYGLGGKTEIDRDDVDRPIKQIPVWAEQRNYLEQMSSQADVDTEMIFAVCEPPNMREMFPKSSNTGISLETPPPAKKSKKIHPEKNGNSLDYFSRNLFTSFCSL